MVPKEEAKITFSILTCRSIVYTTWVFPNHLPDDRLYRVLLPRRDPLNHSLRAA